MNRSTEQLREDLRSLERRLDRRTRQSRLSRERGEMEEVEELSRERRLLRRRVEEVLEELRSRGEEE